MKKIKINSYSWQIIYSVDNIESGSDQITCIAENRKKENFLGGSNGVYGMSDKGDI